MQGVAENKNKKRTIKRLKFLLIIFSLWKSEYVRKTKEIFFKWEQLGDFFFF